MRVIIERLQVAVSDVVNAEKCFSTLANLITTKVPQSRLAALLGDRYIYDSRYWLNEYCLQS